MKKYITIILLLGCLTGVTQNQEVIDLDLESVLKLAKEKSLDVFTAKNMYLRSYWDYKDYRTLNLPTISANFNPLNFRNSTQEIYNSEKNRNEYRSLKTLNSNLGFRLNQPISFTGGNVYLNSRINRLESFGTTSNIAFNNNIFEIGFEQSLFGFNRFKWEKKIAPVKFEKAKKEYIESLQDLYIKAIDYYFALADAQLNLDMSKDNYNNAEKLYNLGKQRFNIATIDKQQLLDLELSFLENEVALSRAERNLSSAQFRLNSFLGFDETVYLKLNIDHNVPLVQVDPAKVAEQAILNNPTILDLKINELQTLKEVKRTQAEKKFNPKISGSVGLNKNANSLSDTYIHPLNQETASVSVEIPIIDWGKRRRNHLKAQKTHEITQLRNKQDKINFRQEAKLLALDFNIQQQRVKNAYKTMEIAKESHQMVLKRFMSGSVDFLNLNSSVSKKDRTHSSYLQSLKTYWSNYYRLQKTTLTDITTGEKLTEQFLLNLKE